MNASQHSEVQPAEQPLLPLSGNMEMRELYHRPNTVHGEIFEFVNPITGVVEIDVIPEDIETAPYSFEISGINPNVIDKHIGIFVAKACNIKILDLAA